MKADMALLKTQRQKLPRQAIF